MRFLAIFIVLATGALGLASACTANVTEGCAAGQCDFGGGTSGATTTAGTGGSDSACMQMPQPVPSAGDIPCDVFAIIHAHCNRCHQGYDPTLEPHMMPTPLNGAPFPLLNYEETQYCFNDNYKRYEVMFNLINPKPNLGPPMPLGGPSLSAADLVTMNAWLSAGAPPAPEGTACGCNDGWPAVTGGLGCTDAATP